MIQKLVAKWKGYKYRFVPWIAYNINKTPVKCLKKEGILLSQEAVTVILQNLFQAFYENHQAHHPQLSPHSKQLNQSAVWKQHQEILKEHLGFCIRKLPSKIKGGGSGVKVTDGMIPAGHLAALYPGTIYRPDEPLFFQSIGNPFILKCVDGVYVDGNHRNISKYIYKIRVQCCLPGI